MYFNEILILPTIIDSARIKPLALSHRSSHWKVKVKGHGYSRSLKVIRKIDIFNHGSTYIVHMPPGTHYRSRPRPGSPKVIVQIDILDPISTYMTPRCSQLVKVVQDHRRSSQIKVLSGDEGGGECCFFGNDGGGRPWRGYMYRTPLTKVQPCRMTKECLMFRMVGVGVGQDFSYGHGM